ncbi:MAG: HipA domain-containing protein [Myxococcales bacterium]|nr:HipA domain-containing protein [Myxococcales bacterium]
MKVTLPAVQVGTLERTRTGLVKWIPDMAWEQTRQRPRLGIGFLRSPGPRQSGTGLLPWFENLLPEKGSILREKLCAAHGLKETDSYRLLGALGVDLSGAVEVSVATPSSPASARVFPENAAPSDQFRFSLAGMQLKFSMSMVRDKLSLAAERGASQWIVKLPGTRHSELPEVEHATMEWAKGAGFDVPPNMVVQTSNLLGLPTSWIEDVPDAFAIERFDRRVDGSKIHQEDLCQALELLPDHKYGDSGSNRIGFDGALKFVSDVAGEDQGREMARRIGFVIASGNTDAHLKNWSLLWGNADLPTLTPCYDFVSTITWANSYGWELANGPELGLTLGGARRFSAVSPESLLALVKRSGLAWSASEVRSGIERARDAWASCQDGMPETMRRELSKNWMRVPLLAEMRPNNLSTSTL